MGKRKSRAKGKVGRPRKETLRHPNGRLVHQPSDPGPTPETARRKQLLVGSNNPLFSDNPVGVLFANGLIDDDSFRAAFRYAWLHSLFFGRPSPASVCYDGLRPGGARDWTGEQMAAFRQQLQLAESAVPRDCYPALHSALLEDRWPSWLKMGFPELPDVQASAQLKAALAGLRRWYRGVRQTGGLTELAAVTGSKAYAARTGGKRMLRLLSLPSAQEVEEIRKEVEEARLFKPEGQPVLRLKQGGLK